MKICSVKDCGRKHHGKGFCSKHYQQLKYCGGVLPISIFDKNEVTFMDNIAEIKIYNRKHIIVATTIVDLEDWEKVKNIKWYLHNSGYAATNKLKKRLFLHHIILSRPSNNFEIDHVNRNRLDNRKSNLRYCTRSQNLFNTGKRIDNTTGFIGICKCKNKWEARITSNFKTKYLGGFASPNEAAQAYNQAALQYHGEFARLNQL